MMFKDKEEHLSGNVLEKWKFYAQNWFDDDKKEPFITISTEDAKAKSPPTTKKSRRRRSSSSRIMMNLNLCGIKIQMLL